MGLQGSVSPKQGCQACPQSTLPRAWSIQGLRGGPRQAPGLCTHIGMHTRAVTHLYICSHTHIPGRAGPQLCLRNTGLCPYEYWGILVPSLSPVRKRFSAGTYLGESQSQDLSQAPRRVVALSVLSKKHPPSPCTPHACL